MNDYQKPKNLKEFCESKFQVGCEDFNPKVPPEQLRKTFEKIQNGKPYWSKPHKVISDDLEIEQDLKGKTKSMVQILPNDENIPETEKQLPPNCNLIVFIFNSDTIGIARYLWEKTNSGGKAEEKDKKFFPLKDLFKDCQPLLNHFTEYLRKSIDNN